MRPRLFCLINAAVATVLVSSAHAASVLKSVALKSPNVLNHNRSVETFRGSDGKIHLKIQTDKGPLTVTIDPSQYTGGYHNANGYHPVAKLSLTQERTSFADVALTDLVRRHADAKPGNSDAAEVTIKKAAGNITLVSGTAGDPTPFIRVEGASVNPLIYIGSNAQIVKLSKRERMKLGENHQQVLGRSDAASVIFIRSITGGSTQFEGPVNLHTTALLTLALDKDMHIVDAALSWEHRNESGIAVGIEPWVNHVEL